MRDEHAATTRHTLTSDCFSTYNILTALRLYLAANKIKLGQSIGLVRKGLIKPKPLNKLIYHFLQLDLLSRITK